ncbi:hypothetical protein NEOLEDRAFT_1180355 [Neolentinus lepideus HHB14362 ss-1]|uniref:Arrestin C-terminal-like domain-containing protein n=1 Tax=Neolentinus lepideus HHB14362 ss-1 TaxID=1314782 RepID=A0A165R097_9AGAM|nr:hypothetical protein NEOLEDRAFT_1180355 [Neolentinus lepideus HHB14362 ss-1]
MDPVPPPAYVQWPSSVSASSYSDVSHTLSRGTQSSSRHLLQDGNCLQTGDFQYDSNSIHVRLRCQPWQVDAPTYGPNGTVEGTVRIDPQLSHVTKVTATLKGKMMITGMERGVPMSVDKIWRLSKYTVLFSYSTHSGSPYGQDHALSIRIPEYIGEGTSPLPPTFKVSHPGVSCEIAYTLSVDVDRQGLRLSKSLKIPIIYFANSRSSLAEIPEQVKCINDQAPREIFEILPYRTSHGAHDPEEILPSVHLSLQKPVCYAAGEAIPLDLVISCRQMPVYNKLLVPNVDIQMIKHTEIRMKAGSNRLSSLGQNVSIRDTPCGKAALQLLDQEEEGVIRLHYTLTPGTEGSWEVPNVMAISYYIQVIITPPAIASKYLASYRKSIPVKLV